MARVRALSGAVPLAMAVALVLSACTVDVEGAPCSAPGEAGQCPGGQACGNDGKCSVRAAACAALAPGTPGARCTPGVGGACVDPEGTPTTGVAKRCTADDAVCGTWVYEPCTPSGLVCGLRAPAGGAQGAWCVCPDQPAGSRELIVRPGGSLAERAPFATGAAAPAACSFRRLGDALVQAGVITVDPSAVATVTAVGAGTDPATAVTITFSAAATGETFPLPVAPRVTLRSDAQTGGGTYRIVFDGEGLPSAPVVLHSGGALAGFTIQNGAGGSANDAIGLACDGSDPALLTSAAVDGRGTGALKLGRGFAAVGAACSVVARDVAIAGCQDGVFVESGHVVLQSVRISANAGVGVRANDTLVGAPRIEIRNSKVFGNGDTGIFVGNANEVRITGTTSSGNGATTVWGTGFPYATSRNAGGIVLIGNPPSGAVEFARNRIYGNNGDQVLVMGAAIQWNLDGPSCGSDAAGPLFGVIGCYDPAFVGTLSYRGIVAVNASVSAQYIGWQSVPSTQQPGGDIGGFTGSVINTVPHFCAADAGLCSEPP